jgi:CheY-like chemotaxis protein
MTGSYIILLIDDDGEDRQIFCDAATEIDDAIKCYTAVDGVDALNWLADINNPVPDIIFLDINMPKMDGKKFLAEKNKIDSLRHIPAVIYTTTKRARDVADTKELGAVDFITKPIKFQDICDEIRSVIARVRKHNYSA